MFIFAGGIFLTSCDKTELVTTNENEGLEKNVEANINVTKEVALTQNDADRELLAKIVAKALTEENFRNIIKSEAILMFDGDYDVLYSKVGTKQNAKGNSIESYLLGTYNQMKGKSASQSEFEKLVSFIPDFQISVPVNCEAWDTKNYTPLVTYVPVLKKWIPVTISYETKWARKDKNILCKLVDSRDSKYTIYGSSYGIMRWGEAFGV